MKKAVVFDLDDTLTKEIDFLKSGYRAVARLVEKRFGLDAKMVYWQMYEWYKAGANAFEKLNETYGLDNPIGDYLNVYRFHQPDIVLSDEVRETLNTLKERGVEMGIVSDGRQETQMNKVKALGLTEWIDESCIIINSRKEDFKPNPIGYDKLMLAMFEKSGESALDFTYVGDNLKKDFICPNAKGWNTICLKDDGRNIHKQDFETVPKEALSQKVISSLRELIAKN